MIKNLENKAKQEKYYNSIINFAHLLKNEERESFIQEVSQYNLLLAAKAIMSAESNRILELDLKKQAVVAAKNFSNPEISSQGFLTLVELEEFNTAFNILKSVKQGNKTHREVLSKIFQNTSLSITLDFMINFFEGDRTNLWDFAINEFTITEKLNKLTFKKIQIISQHLFINKLYFLLVTLLDKVEVNPSKLLQKRIHLIIDEFQLNSKTYMIAYLLKIINKYKIQGYSNSELVDKLIKRGTHHSVKLAIELINEYEIEGYSISEFVDKLIKTGTYGSIKLATELISKYEFESYSNSELVDKLIISETYNSIKAAIELINKYEFEGYSISEFVDKLIKIGNLKSIRFAIELINKYEFEGYSISEFVDKLIKIGNPKSIKFAIELINKYKFEGYSISEFVDKLIKIGNPKSIKFAISLINRYEIEGYSNSKLIGKLIKIGNSSSIKFAIELINRYEIEGYSNSKLIGKLIKIGNSSSIKFAIELINKYEFEGYSNSELEGLLVKKGRGSSIELNELISNNKGGNLTKLIEAFMKSSILTSKEISNSLLRKIPFTGKVISILDYGAFVKMNDYKTDLNLFLHKEQITKQAISHPSEVLQKGQEIEFRIIGINEKNFRFNISCIRGR